MKNRALINRAFTLIELLIVVAIIAILAAIAVPNFLEAQTRAKVSRVKADMRSTATALEAYAVDNNKYPAYYSEFDLDFPAYAGRGTPGAMSRFEHRVSMRLTSPIAYMTSLLNDTFVRKVTGSELAENVPHPFHFSNDHDDSANPAASPGLTQYPVRGLYTMVSTCSNTASPYTSDSTIWVMFSHGPDLVDNNPDDSDPSRPPLAYDPTNGTVSSGDIYDFGPGLGIR